MEEQENVGAGETQARIYELGYLLIGTMPEENVAAKVGAIKDLLEGKGAISISEEFPRLITLGYEMSRPIGNKKSWFNEGYFGWMKFEMDPSATEEIGAILKRDEDVLRYLLIKTVRENTIVGKRAMGTGMKRPARKIENAEETPIDEAEIEKKLEELAVTE
jgi:ribosomal protein S6